MCVMYGETSFSKKRKKKEKVLPNEFATMSRKHSPWSGNTLSSKERFLVATVCKEGHANSLLGQKIKIGSIVNSAFYYELLGQN